MESVKEFIECINVNNFNDLSEKLNNINPEEINQDFINTCTSDLCHLFISAAKNTFGTRFVLFVESVLSSLIGWDELMLTRNGE
jgi:hypothetical protein